MYESIVGYVTFFIGVFVIVVFIFGAILSYGESDEERQITQNHINSFSKEYYEHFGKHPSKKLLNEVEHASEYGIQIGGPYEGWKYVNNILEREKSEA